MASTSKDKRARLASLRAEALRSEGLASRKIKRMASHKWGYDVTGTELDPRAGAERIGRMTEKQLTGHLESLKRFRSPNVGWYSDFNGDPISRTAYRNYKLATERSNKKMREYNDATSDVEMPWNGFTAGDARGKLRPSKYYLESGANYQLHERQVLAPTSIEGEKGVKLLTKMRRDETSESAQQDRIYAMRQQISDMADQIGDSELKMLLENISDRNLWFAWVNDRSLADSLSLAYEASKRLILKYSPEKQGKRGPKMKFMSNATYVNVGNSTLERSKEIIREASKLQIPDFGTVYG